MPTFRPLRDVITDEPKVLPCGPNGEPVEFPGRISARAGALLITMQREIEAAASDPDTADDVDAIASHVGIDEDDLLYLQQQVLGEDGQKALDEHLVYGVARLHVFTTLTTWHLAGEDAAAGVWNSGPGKAAAPNRATRRATGARSSTTAASGTGRSRQAATGGSSRRAAKRPAKSGGRGSSTTGTTSKPTSPTKASTSRSPASSSSARGDG